MVVRKIENSFLVYIQVSGPQKYTFNKSDPLCKNGDTYELLNREVTHQYFKSFLMEQIKYF